MTPSVALPAIAPAPRTRAAAIVRLLPGLAALFTFGVLARGGFKNIFTLGPYELGAAVALLAGSALAVVRRLRRGASVHLRDELELGGCALAVAFVVVALTGERTYPIVYLLTALLVTFFSRPAAITLLGAAVLFDALATLAARPAAFIS
ncbi:MAG: diguanylate cyclase, partial [Myxococcaceae bacterium]|nr:diguanylate cyclase [Myxococcaceae bacterium]